MFRIARLKWSNANKRSPLEARQVERRQLGFDEAVAAFLSDHQAPAEASSARSGYASPNAMA
jgi:hypothetical protein